MFSGLKFSLYEIFGYVFPGILMSFSFLIVCTWIVKVNLILSNNIYFFTMFILMVYMLGHFAQGISNILGYFIKIKNVIETIEEETIKTIIEKINKELGTNLNKSNYNQIYEICNSIALREARTEEIEIYVYREGFYRGTLISSALSFAIILSNCLILGGINININGNGYVWPLFLFHFSLDIKDFLNIGLDGFCIHILL